VCLCLRSVCLRKVDEGGGWALHSQVRKGARQSFDVMCAGVSSQKGKEDERKGAPVVEVDPKGREKTRERCKAYVLLLVHAHRLMTLHR